MSDKPILFSGPMIKAILREIENPGMGKSQTRRLPSQMYFEITSEEAEKFELMNYVVFRHNDALCAAKPQPLCQVGDRLWVKETHAVVGTVDPGWVLYRASGYSDECGRHGFDKPYPPEPKWTPSIFMPRWASRITLEVTDVRVERLQGISEEDTIAEGCTMDANGFPAEEPHESGIGFEGWDCSRDWFADLWDSINGKPRGKGKPDISWAANPWVVAYTFKPFLCNIDQMEGE